jgi:kynurenine formamidase
LQEIFVSAALVSIEPTSAVGCGENYAVSFGNDDLVLTRASIENTLSTSRCDALVVRTLPNDESKLARIYKDTIAPYFTTEAMEYIVSLGVRHLLVDLPSVDRMSDEGKLSNHRIFWNVEQGSFETSPATRSNATVTELIFVPNHVDDGEYLLNLQIAPFESDASPSRPMLFKMKNG